MTSMSKHMRTEDGKDIISSLPDSLLILILSLLPTKYAVRTSILASRWKDLWAFVPVLDFDEWMSPNRVPYYDTSFMNFVDRVLRFHKLPCIEKFWLRGYVGIHVSCLHEWISVAVKRGVQEIDLEMCPDRALSLPGELFNCKTLKLLRLRNQLEFNFPSSVSLPNLKVLHVSLLFPENDLTQKLFSNSPMLEDLNIRANVETEKEITFNVCSPTLKRLEFYLVGYLDRGEHFVRGIVFSENRIVVDAPALEDLIVDDDYLACYSLKNLSSLVSAYIDVGHCCMQVLGAKEHANQVFTLLEGITRVKFLTLDEGTMGALDFADDKKLPLFPNLTKLELRVHNRYSWRRLPDMLNSAPNLVNLILKKNPPHEGVDMIPEFSCWIELQKTPACLSSHLENFTVTGFKWQDNEELTLLKYFLENGKVLKKVKIGTCHLTPEEETDFLMKAATFPMVSETCQIERC